MVHTPTIDAEGQRLLLQLAADSIRRGLDGSPPTSPEIDDLPPALHQPAAAFVTLKIDGDLRGCVGSLEARQPLATAVAGAAHSAAFQDPRFGPLEEREYPHLTIEVSVLGEAEPVAAESEDAAIAQLRPGVDGVILEAGKQCATFLPAVWEQLPDPGQFLLQLRRKAGLGNAEWQNHWRLLRYRCQRIGAANVNEASSTH